METAAKSPTPAAHTHDGFFKADLLFEHQSSPDPAMPLRLPGYVMEILTQHHKAQGFPDTLLGLMLLYALHAPSFLKEQLGQRW